MKNTSQHITDFYDNICYSWSLVMPKLYNTSIRQSSPKYLTKTGIPLGTL